MGTQEDTVYQFAVKEKNSIITIFIEEIKAALQNVPLSTILEGLGDSFDRSEIRAITEASTEKDELAGKEKVYTFASKAHDPRVFVRLVDLVAKHDTASARELRCEDVFDLKHYQQILAAYHTFNLLIEINMLEKLTTICAINSVLPPTVCERILGAIGKANGANSAQSEFISIIRALSIFFQQLPRHNSEWYWIFMQSLSKVPKTGVPLRNAINATFEEELRRYELEKSASPYEKLAVLDTDVSLEDWLRNPALSTASKKESVPVFEGELELDQPEIALRSYQLALAEPALHGQNTVICAPTGSGKTYVAAEIIRRHFSNGVNLPRKKKVAFLVPTVQLVEQQYKVFKLCLSSNLKIKMMKGGTTSAGKAPKTATVLSSDIVVTTPQVLLNIFRDVTASEPVTLSTFTLLILDECHHTDKGYPYNELMVQYSDAKLGENPHKPCLPRIVGLTASLGVGKADDEEKALAHVLHVSANMDAHVLSTISEQHREELAQFVNVPTDRVVPVKQPPHPLEILIEEIMSGIEKIVESDFKALKLLVDASNGIKGPQSSPAPVTIQPPVNKSSPQYTCWVCTWLARLPEVEDQRTKPGLTSALEHLREYNTALDLNAHVPPDQALRFLNDRFEEFERKQSSDRDRDLVGLYKRDLLATVANNPTVYATTNLLVETMTELIMNEFKEMPDARILVFVRTRDLTMALEEYMKNDPRLAPFNASRLTGAQAARKEGGQSMGEHHALMVRFNSGHHKILIATTVAEEGIDVAKCHLVIKYNHVTNEIAMVQRRGRGRAAGSESVLLFKDNWIEEKEATNVLREYLMHKAVACIGSKGQPWFRNQVEKIQLDEFKKRARERVLAEKQRQKVAGKSYNMLCKKCGTLVISTKDIRILARSHYVGADPSVWQRLCLEPGNQPRIFETMVIAGSVSCAHCRIDCGIIIQYSNVFLPALKMDAFSLKPANGGALMTKKKWSQAVPAYFVVDEVENSDLREMFRALDKNSVTTLETKIHYAKSTASLSSGNGDDDDD